MSGQRGLRLKSHNICICGFPRSGTSMFYAMMCSTLNDHSYAYFEQETKAEQVLVTDTNFITKRPLDSLHIEKLKRLTPPNKKLTIIWLIRDPRSVITSIHANMQCDYFIGYDNQYFINGPNRGSLINPGLNSLYQEYKKYQDKIITIKYEDLILNSDEVQEKLFHELGLKASRKFSEFGSDFIIPSGVECALNGVRPIDSTRLSAWKNHPERIRNEFTSHPELFEMVTELGYEKDNTWFNDIKV